MSADDLRRTMSRFQDANLVENLHLVTELRRVAEGLGATPAQTALAWLLARNEMIIPIPGTKRMRYLEENVAAVDLQLTAEQVAQFDTALPAGAVAGERYAARAMLSLGH